MSNIKINGLGNVLLSLDKIANTAKLNNSLEKACALVEREAKRKAPKGDGSLRRSITSNVENLEGVIYTPLEYAPYVEYGTGLFAEKGGRLDVPWNYKDDEGNWHITSGMKPQPYMRPALYESKNEIVRIIKEGIIDD